MQDKILDLGYPVLLHPPHLPNLASTDFHLFFSTLYKMFLMKKKFPQEDQVKMYAENVLLKPGQFYLRKIEEVT